MKFQISNLKFQIPAPQPPASNTQSEILNHRSEIQNGYTLVELLVVIALLSLVTGVLSMAIYQFYTVTTWGNAQLAVDADLRNAGAWLMRDGNESESFTPGGTCGVFYTGLTRNISYTYTYSGHTLSRQDSSSGQTLGVAHRVTGVQCIAGAVPGTVKVTLTSTSGDISNSATFTVTLRVD